MRDLAPVPTTAVLVGVFTLLLYLPTVAPTVTLRNNGGDSGDLVRAAWTLGVPHPTGYPLWVLLAHAATWLPFGEPAYRVALLSALAAAGGVAMAALAAQEVLRHAVPDIAGGLGAIGPAVGGAVLGCSLLFWQQATIPETYALDSFLIALGMWLLLRWLRGVGPLWPVSLVAALALANHLVSLSLLAALIVGVVIRRP
ncbi:MAG: protein O-mannosyl-transferase family [Chloroflexota bacterium]